MTRYWFAGPGEFLSEESTVNRCITVRFVDEVSCHSYLAVFLFCAEDIRDSEALHLALTMIEPGQDYLVGIGRHPAVLI